jgi:hypothetical protein
VSWGLKLALFSRAARSRPTPYVCVCSRVECESDVSSCEVDKQRWRVMSEKRRAPKKSILTQNPQIRPAKYNRPESRRPPNEAQTSTCGVRRPPCRAPSRAAARRASATMMSRLGSGDDVP